MQKHSIVVLFGLLVLLPALVVCSALPPTNQRQMNHKLELPLEQPNANSNNGSDHKIVGGSTAFDGQFPHMVSFRYNNQHFCGGSIISDSWILTAAHCFDSYLPLNDITAVVGTNTLNSGGTAYDLEQIIQHGQYDMQTMLNDIAVVQVYQTIEFEYNVNKISLPLFGQLPYSRCTLSGWGLTSYPGSIPNDLQYIDLQTIDLATCALYVSSIRPIGLGHVCTLTHINEGGCQGDSGGPLIDYDVQIGIVSWGNPCANGFPDVYTSVAFYRLWISDHTGI